MFCYKCDTEVIVKERVEFRAECPKCNAQLHVCLNCKFYRKNSYNQCKEPNAERVTDKDRFNHCEYFKPSDVKTEKKNNDNLKDKFNNLFK